MEMVRYAFVTNSEAISIPKELSAMYRTQQEALNALQDAIEDMTICEEDVQNWELVRMTLDVIQNAITKFQ